MMNAARYLEEAKIEDLESMFLADGYRVTRSPNGDSPPFDLIAEKPGKKVAIDVKSWASSRKTRAQLVENQSAARLEGFDSYKLYLVRPPHRTEVVVEGLEGALLAYLRGHMPPEIEAMAKTEADCVRNERLPPAISHTLHGIEQIDFDRIDMRRDHVRVVGNGLLLVSQHEDHHVSPDGIANPIASVPLDFPFHFDILLDREHQVLKSNEIRVDTSDCFD